ncbi:uncharacterized protein FTOL_08840 [Fusarium torulosum]|uniref:RING-type domain-containing protein n=1 Tax=Fusarium torulosum TaxID=33205 RepID=A0AAE8MEC8_9HYPO|nr:uncharacterized protein FTOL_08840 [Fusarium torulosum]
MDSLSPGNVVELVRQAMGMEPSSEGKQLAAQYTDIDLAFAASNRGINVLEALLFGRAPASDMAQTTDVQAGEEEPVVRDCQPPRELFTDPEAKPARNNKGNMSSDDPEGDPNRATSSNNFSPPLVVNGSINQEGVALYNPSYLASSRAPPADRECMGCNEMFTAPDIFTAPCSHEYCRTCITRLVTTALQDLSDFPPQCCGERIPVEHGVWFSQQIVDQFQAREVEHNTEDHRPKSSTMSHMSSRNLRAVQNAISFGCLSSRQGVTIPLASGRGEWLAAVPFLPAIC